MADEQDSSKFVMFGKNGFAQVTITIEIERDPEPEWDGNSMRVEALHLVDNIQRVLVDECNMHAAEIRIDECSLEKGKHNG